MIRAKVTEGRVGSRKGKKIGMESGDELGDGLGDKIEIGLPPRRRGCPMTEISQ